MKMMIGCAQQRRLLSFDFLSCTQLAASTEVWLLIELPADTYVVGEDVV